MKYFFYSCVALGGLISFSGCTNQSMNDLAKLNLSSKTFAETKVVPSMDQKTCSIDKIENELSPEEKKRLYEKIKLEVTYLMDDAKTLEEKGYNYLAKQTYELVNFYADKNIVPPITFQKLDSDIAKNSEFFYEQASAASAEGDTIQTLIEMNNLMKNDPFYENGQKIFFNLLEKYSVKELLDSKKETLEELLKTDSIKESYISDLHFATQDLAQFNHLDPLVKKAIDRLKTKRHYLLEDAKALFEQNKYQEAKKKFDFVKQIFTVDRTSNFYLAQIESIERQIQKRRELAEQERRKAEIKAERERKLALIKNDLEAKMVKLFKEKKYPEAIAAANDFLEKYRGDNTAKEILRKSKKAVQNSVPELLAKGEEAYLKQDLKVAVKYLEQALLIDKDNNTAKTLIRKIKAQLKTLEGLQW